MEGVLYKWTNYMSGWQPRWFVLEGGTLSYYDSQEDVWKGCKGSIRVCVCEIKVHPTDVTRMDLTVPGEQHFYLKALNAAERQKWLVALGTAKACLTDNRTKREKELQENTKALKTKMSELRLYCDLLLQQADKLREGPPGEELRAAPGEDAPAGKPLLKSTCNMFLKTLEECMLVASRTFSEPDSLLHIPTGLAPVAAVRPQKVKPHNRTSQVLLERREFDSGSGGASACERADRERPECRTGPPAGESQAERESGSTQGQIALSESCSAGDARAQPAGSTARLAEGRAQKAEDRDGVGAEDVPPAPADTQRCEERCCGSGPGGVRFPQTAGRDESQERGGAFPAPESDGCEKPPA